MASVASDRTAATGALDVERIRESFPTLSRMIGDEPLVYLDSGASSQRVLASIEAVDRYERRHHSNVHRGSHTLSAEATAAYEGARATVADHLGAADRREIVFVRNATEAINLVARAWGAANVGAGDRIVLTEMEHHSNIVPWQQLAEATGAEIDWVGIDDDGELLRERARGRARPRAEAASRSPTSRTSSARSTRSPRSPRMAHDAGALVLVDGAQSMPKMGVDVGELGVDFYAVTGHKAYGPTGIGALWARLDLLREMPPFLGGGSMIRKVTKEGTTFADPPARFEAGTPAIAQAIGLAAALRWLDAARDGRASSTTSARSPPTRSSGSARSPGLRIFGPPAGARADRPGLLRDRRHPRPRRRRDPRPPRRRRPRRPPLRPAADGAARRRRHRPRELRRLHDRARRSTASSRGSTTPARSSGSRSDGRALPRSDPRALQAAAQLRPARRLRPRLRGHEPVLRRRAARLHQARRRRQGRRDLLRGPGLRDLDRRDLAADRRARRHDPRGAPPAPEGDRPRPARDRHLRDPDEVRDARPQGRQVRQPRRARRLGGRGRATATPREAGRPPACRRRASLVRVGGRSPRRLRTGPASFRQTMPPKTTRSRESVSLRPIQGRNERASSQSGGARRVLGGHQAVDVAEVRGRRSARGRGGAGGSSPSWRISR